MHRRFSESVVEDAALAWLEGLGYSALHGPEIADVTIDWTVRDNVRANLRVLVKRILRKHGYPPDKQERAAQLVLEQAEVLSAEWAAA
jgi:type I restriction enzyme R subunit